MKILCTICARGGSKGVPNKNIRPIAGKPLITHTLEHAINSQLFDWIAVSSDSDKILDTAQQSDIAQTIKRPDILATDTSGKIPAIIHALQQAEEKSQMVFDYIVDLDATSPLRMIDDIKNCLEMIKKHKVSNIITGMTAHRSPYFNLVEENENGSVSLSKQLPNAVVRRQDSPKCYDMNASIYVWNRHVFLNEPKLFYDDTMMYEMPYERSLDIDSILDFDIVEFLMTRKGH